MKSTPGYAVSNYLYCSLSILKLVSSPRRSMEHTHYSCQLKTGVSIYRNVTLFFLMPVRVYGSFLGGH